MGDSTHAYATLTCTTAPNPKPTKTIFCRQLKLPLLELVPNFRFISLIGIYVSDLRGVSRQIASPMDFQSQYLFQLRVDMLYAEQSM